MLILDRQKAVERVVALTFGVSEAYTEPTAGVPHTRTYQRIATYVRRTQPAALPPRRGAERRRRTRPIVEQSHA